MRIGDDPDAHARPPPALCGCEARERERERRAASRVKFSTAGAAPLAAEEVHISMSAPTICFSQPRLSSVFFRFTASRSFRVSSTPLARSNPLLYSFLFFFLSSNQILVTVLDLFVPALLFKNSHRCWRQFCSRRTRVAKSPIFFRMFIVAMQSGFVLDLKLFRATNG
ncbi:hypothetical protein MUK42_01523 [Musa troglodytarum]|uniref:Uncharacterized protein n=1 Tax=Musa troglodytarum TaxID=320322 RepID=A0A9E7FAG4_9LILI|nr:hypothetical protein MUK42_01523 [Musa troglodytarum]